MDFDLAIHTINLLALHVKLFNFTPHILRVSENGMK